MRQNWNTALLEECRTKYEFLGGMGKNDKPYGLVADLLDRREHLLRKPVGNAGIDDYDAVGANDEPCITGETAIRWRYFTGVTDKGIDARCNPRRLDGERE